ncbi:MAG TPA: TetR/AcrR family transcriptional regulator [Acidimicrobiales bacterium]|nr:TetR/AcrR family transcriptional regulator [Acidimicrobiales bacterium]
MSSPDGGGQGAEPTSVVRRAPFSDNPRVGARGQRTQQRILDAALRVFGEEGYQNCSIDRIAKQAGCSRVSFYQYFSSKEDVFRQLAGHVARQLMASADALDPVTADLAGWTSLRGWVGRHADIYERYQPMFQSFPAASQSDSQVATGSARWAERIAARLRSSLGPSVLPPRQIDPVLLLLREGLTRTLDIASILRTSGSDHPRARIEDALTDVMHRSFFGRVDAVNVHGPARRRPSHVPFGPSMQELLQPDDRFDDAVSGRRALTALLESGRDVFVTRGYHATRVDDLAEAAGVSHGAFYRYFRNKDELARVLTVDALRTVSTEFVEIPDIVSNDGAAGHAALRKWLRRYHAAQAHEAAMIRVWVDAALQDATLRADSAAAFDWGWRRMARFLQPRGFGDVDSEAVFMLGLMSAFGWQTGTPASVDAAAHVIEAGLLGR